MTGQASGDMFSILGTRYTVVHSTVERALTLPAIIGRRTTGIAILFAAHKVCTRWSCRHQWAIWSFAGVEWYID